ncbi:hypothetical protein VIBNIFTn2_1110042 [Vibrio nigripulchritudo FTn2]|uniref:H-NS family histone-like protein n=1 Tax=Vibrio nigripulchritudo TaxID=28173 RepID=UPI0003B236DB|nr:hypothetical protein [Vibrio nigripulchritudo]CCN39744.1 hypothetical protein VIBNIFTn2_1110042 [Vibrio nigripulchritudo FTn2]
MNDLVKIFGSARKVKAQLKNVHSEQIEKMIVMLQQAKEDREIEELEEKERQEQEHKLLCELRDKILEEGIDFEKLSSLMPSRRTRRAATKISKKNASSEDISSELPPQASEN